MNTLVKIAIIVCVVFVCGQVARIRPTLAGLISVMPLTGLLAMIAAYMDCSGDPVKMGRYTLGAVWGILPAILFFIVAYLGFRRQLHLAIVLGLSAAVWLAGAILHQHFLGKG